jgi:hypothetical protein
MHKYIVDTLGAFAEYQSYEHLFDFYQGGFAGLIADYFEHHKAHPNDEVGDRAFVDRVFQRYFESQQFHGLYVNDVEQHHVEVAITAATYLVGRTVSEFIKQNRHLLKEFALTRDTVEVGTEMEYLLLEKK